MKVTSDTWRDHATCRNISPEIHFPDEPIKTDQVWDAARTYCRACPVKTWCLDLALKCETPGYRYGMYGGLTPNEREQLDRRRWTP